MQRRPVKHSSKLRLLFTVNVVFMVVTCSRLAGCPPANGSIYLKYLQ